MKSGIQLTRWSRYLVFTAAVCMLCATCVRSQMVAKLTRYEVHLEYQEQFRKVITEYVLYSLAMENNIMCEAYFEKEKPNTVWLIERWQNRAELNRANTGAQFKAIQNLENRALTQPSELYYVKDLEPLSKQQWRKPAKEEDHPLTVMLFVDAKPGTQKKFKDLYHEVMPQFRSEPGVITYQLSQSQTIATQFVTYEKFRSDEAFQYHLKFPPIQPVIDYLETSIQKQPFRNGLHTLIEFAPLTRE